MTDKFRLAQGPAVIATPEEVAKETDPGYTRPNLHRRIDNDIGIMPNEDAYFLTSEGYYLTTEDDYCILVSVPESASSYLYHYDITVGGVQSFRTSTTTIHNEDDNPLEIP